MIQQQPPPGIPDFLKGWGSLIIATIALVQPWLIAAWKRFFRSGDVDIYPTSRIEIGYSGVGPTIGLAGTLRAVHRDMFVENLQLIVTNLKDQARHVFDWVVFRTGKIYLSGSQREEMTAELVSGFMITTSQPHPYNILFSDTVTQAEMDSHVQAVRSGWSTRLISSAATTEPDIEQLFEEFMKGNRLVTDNYMALERLSYWKPGRYMLEIIVNTTRPDASFVDVWSFELTAQDVGLLGSNPVGMLRNACERPSTLGFAYVDYEEPPPDVAEGEP